MYFYRTDVDLKAYVLWMNNIREYGFLNIYNEELLGEIVDYPPMYPFFIYLFSPIASRLSDVDVGAFQICFKMCAVAGDVLITVLLSRRCGLKTGALWAVNPAVIVNDAMWAQIDVLFVLFVYMFLMCIVNKKVISTGVVFALSCVLKPQGIYLFPVYILFLVTEKTDLKKKLISFACGAATGVLCWLPFIISMKDIMLPFKRYLGLAGLYSYYSADCANAWYFLSLQEFPEWAGILNYFLMILCVGVLIFIYRKEKNIVIATAVYLYSICMFVLNQHDRYPIYFTAVFLLIYILYKDREYLKMYIASSVALGLYEIVMVIRLDDYFPMETMIIMATLFAFLDLGVNFWILYKIVRKTFFSRQGQKKLT